jgi:hypothetical protein
MRNFLLIFIIPFTDFYGQSSIDVLTENIRTYKTRNYKWADNTPRPNKFKSLVYMIFKDTLNSFCSDLDTVTEFKAFHSIDIDKDNDLDIIFQGNECGGSESESVIIYLNIKGKYEKRLHSNGKIIFLNNSKDLTIYEYPCCAMTKNSFVLYSISKDNISLNSGITFFDSYLLHGESPGASPNYKHIVPKSLKLSGDITIKEDAILNYLPLDTIIGGTYIKNNFVASVSKQTIVKFFSTFVDENGTKWFYCKISNKDVRIDGKYQKYPFLIWVRQKYCS